jgi:acetolactate synthase-1/2/3 large subunit
MKSEIYSDQICDWLVEEGYTHCFFVAGGNIMHLLNSARTRFTCVPVVHEVTAAIAVEYFNESNSNSKAFALVTAGPGITNAVTGIAGAWLEGRNLLVIGGQVKSIDLKSDGIRQRGVQEIDGVGIVREITKFATCLVKAVNRSEFLTFVKRGSLGKPGPVFLEICLDVQGSPLCEIEPYAVALIDEEDSINRDNFQKFLEYLNSSRRPIILIGGGVHRSVAREYLGFFQTLGIPIMTTWNGLDRIDSSEDLFWGRPNTWGQRSANILIQQSDLIIAIGTRLGLQQTGFNWQKFGNGSILVQIDIEASELSKGHPRVDLVFNNDSGNFLREWKNSPNHVEGDNFSAWREFGKYVKKILPNNDTKNSSKDGYINPFTFVETLSEYLNSDCVVIPCSSGGAFTTMMQAFRQKSGQVVVSNKGLASMGYGLAGSIGAAYANPNKRIILVEGDGGFLQNIQDLGTVKIRNLPIKIFIYVNNGYASIRMTQLNYFGGAYIGCDESTGLGMPNWFKLFESFDIPVAVLDSMEILSEENVRQLHENSPRAFIVPIDPEQTYYPKITSRVLENGLMESNPLHLMTPELEHDVSLDVFKFLSSGGSSNE